MARIYANTRKPANWWKFGVGLPVIKTVTVFAPNYSEAWDKAQELLDEREHSTPETAGGWMICLIEARYNKRQGGSRG